MGNFNVTLKYEAQYSVTVEANDEGEACDKARKLAENADLKEFQLSVEKEASVEYR